MTVLITRVELNLAALVVLLLYAVLLVAQPAWAGETQAASPTPSEATQANVPSLEEQRTNRPSEQRLGPLARRVEEIIFSDDLRLSVPQSPLHLDQLLHVPEWLHLGLDFRTRYEAYSQPVKKNETTGAAQFSERTDVQLCIH
jgi:hypothetical protein